MNKIKKIPTFLKEVKKEMQRVSWLNKKETLTFTGNVLIVVAILTTFLWLMDVLISNISNHLF